MKRFFSLVFCVVLCLSLFACKDNTAETDDDADEIDGETGDDGSEEEKKVIVDKKYNLSEITDSLKLLGRNTVTSDGIICDMSASGIEFCAYIEGDVDLGVSVSPRVTPSGSNDIETYYTVYIDGERVEERFKVSTSSQILKIANFKEGGVHTIRVLKQTEAQNSLSVLKTIDFVGYFEDAPKNKDLLIEFLGDSITSGYGNICANGTANPGNALNQDATQTYAYLTAQKLDADHSLVSYSGIGIAKGWPTFIMEEFFAKDSYCRDTVTDYTPSFTPDIVVINLGTNDAGRGATSTDFVNKTRALINLVRDTYGNDVKIVWVYNMMSDSMQFLADKVIRDMGGEESGIYVCQLPREKTGGGGHPSVQGHVAAAEVLANFIKDKGLA